MPALLQGSVSLNSRSSNSTYLIGLLQELNQIRNESKGNIQSNGETAISKISFFSTALIKWPF